MDIDPEVLEREEEDLKRESFDHGYAETAWEAAKAEARDAMVEVAARRRVIAYSDLVAGIRSLDLEPQDDRLAHLLDEISTAEHAAGRGMLTVVVVHKHGDQAPEASFFELARSLGHDTKDREALWVTELEKVYGPRSGRTHNWGLWRSGRCWPRPCDSCSKRGRRLGQGSGWWARKDGRTRTTNWSCRAEPWHG